MWVWAFVIVMGAFAVTVVPWCTDFNLMVAVNIISGVFFMGINVCK